jgi:hypothetical protein
MAKMRRCIKCNIEKNLIQFLPTKSKLFEEQFSTICRDCAARAIDNVPKEKRWKVVNKLCQWIDIPFLPQQWNELYEKNGFDAFGMYVSMFKNQEYETLDWETYNIMFLKLKEEERVEDAIPELKKNKLKLKRQRWGIDYDEIELEYLDNLYNGIVSTQSVVGSEQEDKAKKLCKIALRIEDKIRAGGDIDKDIRSYDMLSKSANFTPKSSESGEDFDSLGELFAYLEDSGWINKYYQDEIKDIVDETIKQYSLWVQNLYIKEPGMAEEIQERIEQLKVSKDLIDEQYERDIQTALDIESEDELSNEEFNPEV